MVANETNGPKPTRVFIVDDHPVVRLGLRQLILQETGIEVCGEAESVKGAIEQLDAVRPDVAIVDLALPDANGIELIKHLKHYWVGVRIIVVSTYPETAYGSLARQAGADVYINKHEAMDQIIQAIRTVSADEFHPTDSQGKTESHWFG